MAAGLDGASVQFIAGTSSSTQSLTVDIAGIEGSGTIEDAVTDPYLMGDTDGDGLIDSEEVDGDTDGDGLVDYLDNDDDGVAFRPLTNWVSAIGWRRHR